LEPKIAMQYFRLLPDPAATAGLSVQLPNNAGFVEFSSDLIRGRSLRVR
jgi:hypothetical protein